MTEQEIKQAIINLLRQIAPDTAPEQLELNENFRQSLAIDSFDYLQFIVGIDEHFNIETPEEDYGKIQTIKDLIRYILDKTARVQS